MTTDVPLRLMPSRCHPCERCGRLFYTTQGVEKLLEINQSAKHHERWTCFTCYCRPALIAVKA